MIESGQILILNGIGGLYIRIHYTILSSFA